MLSLSLVDCDTKQYRETCEPDHEHVDLVRAYEIRCSQRSLNLTNLVEPARGQDVAGGIHDAKSDEVDGRLVRKERVGLDPIREVRLETMENDRKVRLTLQLSIRHGGTSPRSSSARCVMEGVDFHGTSADASSLMVENVCERI